MSEAEWIEFEHDLRTVDDAITSRARRRNELTEVDLAWDRIINRIEQLKRERHETHSAAR